MNIINWFIRSSVNPDRYALTIRGLGIGIIPIATFFGVSALDVNSLFEGIAEFTIAFFGSISTFMVVYGLIRKIGLTIAYYFNQ